MPEPTIAQRSCAPSAPWPSESVRDAARRDLAQRLASVLEVICLVFNEGYTATAGSDWMRPELAQEALRLGRMLAEIAPRERRCTAWWR